MGVMSFFTVRPSVGQDRIAAFGPSLPQESEEKVNGEN
jgi:hypothetical protein